MQTLSKHAREQCEGIFGEPKFIVDTGRNGNGNARKPEQCHDWCNVKEAGAGAAPSIRSPLPQLIDAYFWLKTPGESDGCTMQLPNGRRCARFDPGCGRQTSLGGDASEPRAPEAGGWFHAHALVLARNAQLRFDGGVSHGALRGDWVPNSESTDGGSAMGHLIESWSPSPRSMILLIGLGVFFAICACGAFFACTTTLNAGDNLAQPSSFAFERLCLLVHCISRACYYVCRATAGRGRYSKTSTRGSSLDPATSPSPRTRATMSVTYKCEPRYSGQTFYSHPALPALQHNDGGRPPPLPCHQAPLNMRILRFLWRRRALQSALQART